MRQEHCILYMPCRMFKLCKEVDKLCLCNLAAHAHQLHVLGRHGTQQAGGTPRRTTSGVGQTSRLSAGRVSLLQSSVPPRPLIFPPAYLPGWRQAFTATFLRKNPLPSS